MTEQRATDRGGRKRGPEPRLQPVEARFGLPAVFVPVFVQTHLRVRINDGGLVVELWDDPRPVDRQLRWIDPFRIVPKGPKSIDRRLQWIEWLAIVGRMPTNPPPLAEPRIISRRVLPSVGAPGRSRG